MAVVCLTVDQCKNWDTVGRNEFINQCKKIPTSERDSKSILSCGTKKDWKRAIFELSWHVIKNNLKIDQATSVLQELVGIHSHVVSIFLDVVAVIDLETQMNSADVLQRERFNHFVAACASFIPERFIKERLDMDSLSDVGIVKNKKLFYTKFIKTKTKLFYKQQKFNLFREESEGYAKLIVELNQEFNNSITSAYLMEIIKALIGCFNLDPNRVLDVILESFECRPNLHSVFIPLIRSYMCNQNTLCEMLGFKFTFYQNVGDVLTPESLYTVAALMVHHELVPLNGVYSHLKPPDSEIVEEHKKQVQEARLYSRKLNIVSTMEKPDSKPAEENDISVDQVPFNQKLGLVEALLKIGSWKNAKSTISCMPEQYVVSYPPITRALCDLIRVKIDVLYKKHCTIPKIITGSCLPKIADEFPQTPVQTFGELKESVFPMLCTLGPQLHTDPILMIKVIRLAKVFLVTLNVTPDALGSNEKDLYYHFLTILDEALLPSLSLLDSNCCMAEELWSLLKLYPYHHRYRLYGLWKNENYLNHPLLIKTKADYIKKIRYIMKRLSKENVKPSGRHIGKLGHSNPGFLFDYILSQIQTWDNLIVPVVDSLKYLTNLSYDVLSYCIVEALANPDKMRMKVDGTSISLWLQSLSSFCGAVYKKYSIELTGLLQYVANQLKAEKCLDLLILKEIVQKMAGIEALEEMTNDQLEAMSGGELLRAEGGYFSQIRNTKKSSQRLKEVLLEHDLVAPLCLLMAQQRNCIIFKDEENYHLKLVGKLYDQCQDTLVQFGSFLASNLSMEDYARRLPSVYELMGKYHLMAEVAFFLSRPMFSHTIASAFDEMRKQDKTYRAAHEADKMQKYLELVDNIMKPAVDSMRFLYTPKVWEDISPQFFVTFWSLSMYDLHVPAASYEREITKLKTQIGQIEENKDMVQTKKKKEIDRCRTLKDKLQDEQKRQNDHCDRVLARLQNEKDTWFLSRSAKNETITMFIHLCVFPRCIFTAVDAIYCAKFLHTIHNLKTPNFSTLICYDKIFCDITYSVTSCTENEANRYGRFLCATLKTVMHWHSDKEVFEKECANYPGFVTKYRIQNQLNERSCDHVDYENYRHVCHKWHYKLTKAIIICLESGDYVAIRNALIVLTKVLPHFPVLANLGGAVEKRIENVKNNEKEKRQDLYVLAMGYAGQLRTKKPTLIAEHEFHQKENKEIVKPPPQPSNAHNHEPQPTPITNAAIGPDAKQDKTKDNVSTKDAKEKDKKVVTASRAESKAESKVSTMKVNVDAQKVAMAGLTSGNASSNSTKDHGRPVTSKTPMVQKDADKEQNATTSSEKEVGKVSKKDEKSTKEEWASEDSPHHTVQEKREVSREREGKGHTRMADAEKDRKVERAPSVTSIGSGSQRRSTDPPDTEKEVKRKKLDLSAPSVVKSPHHEERSREKIKESERGATQERKPREKSDKSREGKTKDREKAERKRERLEERESSVTVESKKRKEDDLGKSQGRQNGENESRDRERHKRGSHGHSKSRNS